MSKIVEKGYSISNEFEGSNLKHTIKKTIVKEWVGEVSSNINIVSGGSGGYSSVSVAGQSYGNAKISNVSYEFRGNQAIKVTEIEQKLTPEGCIGPCGINEKNIDEFSDSVKIEKGKDSISFSRDIFIKVTNESSTLSVPFSRNSGLIDSAISCAKRLISDTSSLSSSDPQISEMISEASSECGDEKLQTSLNEKIDKEGCSVSLSKTITKKLGACESNCEESSSTSISYDDAGLVSITVSGDIKGQKEDYQCDGNGIPISIKKSKHAYALECYKSVDLDSKLVDLYEEHKQEACEDDVCLALRVQSRSKNICEKDGTISYSLSASEEEVFDNNGGDSKVKDKSNKSGCVTSITRTFEFSTNVRDPFTPLQNPEYLAGDCADVLNQTNGGNVVDFFAQSLSSLDTSPPAGFFGPLSMSINASPSAGTLSGSVNFDNNPANDPSKNSGNGMTKKQTVTTTVCPQEINDSWMIGACGGRDMQKFTTGSPGSTKECKDVEMFHCATADDIVQAININGKGLIVEDTFSISLSDGAKTGSACKKWHTNKDLRGAC